MRGKRPGRGAAGFPIRRCPCFIQPHASHGHSPSPSPHALISHLAKSRPAFPSSSLVAYRPADPGKRCLLAGWWQPHSHSQSCLPARSHLPLQVPGRGCGSTLMLLTQALLSCAPSSGGFWRELSMLIPSPLILPSGWWCTLTVLGSGECGSQAPKPRESLASSGEGSAANNPLETHRVKNKYKLQQTFSVNPIYLRHANSGAATDFMVSGQQWAARAPLRWLHVTGKGLFRMSALVRKWHPVSPPHNIATTHL